MKFKKIWYNLIGVKKYTDKIEGLEDTNTQLQSLLNDNRDYIIKLENQIENLENKLNDVKNEKFIEDLRKYI